MVDLTTEKRDTASETAKQELGKKKFVITIEQFDDNNSMKLVSSA